jgi:glycosyltransferase involved in cell wall biosynthesis
VRILHVTPFYEPAPSYGGIARAAAGLARAQVRAGHQVTVATAMLERDAAREEAIAGVRIIRFPGATFWRNRLVADGRGVDRFIGTLDVDLAHLHGSRSLIVVRSCSALQRARVPWVLQAHGTLPCHGQRSAAKRVFDLVCGGAQVVRGARALLAVSEAEARDLPRASSVVGNGIELAGGRCPSKAASEGMLFVGSDARQKRGLSLRTMLDALPDTALRLVGRFSRGFVRRFQPWAARVTVLGPLHDGALMAEYRRARVLVHPSVGEAFGFVPFEGALCGTPAVVMGGHGCGEVFGRAGGCVVPSAAPEAFLGAIRERLADQALGMREAARVAEYVEAYLTWDAVERRVASVYAAALGAVGDLPTGKAAAVSGPGA